MNTCFCPPPGGSITCPDDHSAICRIENGQAHGECVPLEPDDVTTRVRLLELVTGIQRRRLDGTLSRTLTPEDEVILQTRRYVRGDGIEVTFRIGRRATNRRGGATL